MGIHKLILNTNNKLVMDNVGKLKMQKLLTYPGSTHTEEDVLDLGGYVYTLPSGDLSGKTIGVFPQDYNHTTLDAPIGWALAGENNYRWFEVREQSFTDYCGYVFASYNYFPFGPWPETNLGYGGATYYSRYVNCTQASASLSPRSDFWTIYYLDGSYTIRALHKTTWVFGTDNEFEHVGHEIASFGAY